MSVIIHRCQNCGHPDYWGVPNRDGDKMCPGKGWGSPSCSCITACVPDEPEVIPTYGHDGKPIERIIEPGKPITPGVVSCGCDDCLTLYAGLTAA